MPPPSLRPLRPPSSPRARPGKPPKPSVRICLGRNRVCAPAREATPRLSGPRLVDEIQQVC
eukprot:573726-Amorphochlora_amoeboformis.AAC.2